MTVNHLSDCLDQYMDRELPPAGHVLIETHIAGCASCRALLERELNLRHALQQLPVAAPHNDFYRRAMTRAMRSGHAAGAAPWTTAAAAALAASVATWFIAGPTGQFNFPQATSPVLAVTMAAYESRTIHLVFESPTDMSNARLRVQLPPGVQLASYGDRQDLHWKTHIRQGKNLLPLDLILRGSNGGDLVAQLSHAGKRKTFRVTINVSTRRNYT